MAKRTGLLFFSLFLVASGLRAQPARLVRDTIVPNPGGNVLVAVPAQLPDQDSADDRPCFSLDGRTMYFGSRRPSKDPWRKPDPNPSWKWDSDLWYRKLTDSGWSAPINVGAPINNSGGQLNPTVSPRGDVLYYVSGGPTLWMARIARSGPGATTISKIKEKASSFRSRKSMALVRQADTAISQQFQSPTPVGGMLNYIYQRQMQVMAQFHDSIWNVVNREMLPDSDLKYRAPDAWNLHFIERLTQHLKTSQNADFYSMLIRCESTITPDGKAAIISENFGKHGEYGMDGEGGEDLWLVTIDAKGGWDTVKYLGGHINSPYDETYPFLAADGVTLYFTSNRPCKTCLLGTSGAQDLYRAQWNGTTWSDPVPLGPPFNSASDDYGFSIGPDGKTAYFVSNRTGKSRLYQVSLSPTDSTIAPKPVVVLQGTVTDAKTHKPLAAEIFVDDLSADKASQSVMSDSVSGAYMLAAQRGHRFGVQAIADGHLPHSERFTVPQEGSFDRTKLDLELAATEVGARAELKNVYFEFGKADLLPESKLELTRMAQFLRKSNKTTLEIDGHTDDVGTLAANQTLSENRAKAVLEYLALIGINRARMKAVGFGKTRPRVKGTSDEARAQNRRVEMTITSESD
ncbi:MAG: OmpA family protein [Bacteroidota bacterium]|nr:OmpA family protein [Bacteroidota bacterium]MDP4241897.1 OmpA family protein [Bacteroidota bacterium]MDP4288222.1 OmpA family protein [Bacteroidota bacterium]